MDNVTQDWLLAMATLILMKITESK